MVVVVVMVAAMMPCMAPAVVLCTSTCSRMCSSMQRRAGNPTHPCRAFAAWPRPATGRVPGLAVPPCCSALAGSRPCTRGPCADRLVGVRCPCVAPVPAVRWATLCRQAPKAAAVGAAQRVPWPAHAVPHRSTDMKAPRRCSVECAHGTGTCLRGRKGAPRARCGCTRGACWFFAKAVHSHGYAMASCMRNRTIALFTTRHLAEVPADLGRGIEGAQASTEQQPIVRLSSILGPRDTCIE